MNSQITEMAKRFMVETYGPPDTIDRLNWDAKLRTVILALEFAEKERGFSTVCPKCGNYVAGHATGGDDICTCYLSK